MATLVKLLHGTSTEYLGVIKNKGLKSPSYSPGWMGVFLTDDENTAEYFAEIRADHVGGSPVVCEVNVGPSTLSADKQLYSLPTPDLIDEHYCNLGGMRINEECWNEKIETGEIPYPKNDRDWRTSLDTVHSVIAQKDIPPKNIKCRSRG